MLCLLVVVGVAHRYLMTAMIGASAVAASLLVMVEPSGTGLEGVWAALAVLMVGRLATLGWRFQSADGPLPPTHLQHKKQQQEQEQELAGAQQVPQHMQQPHGGKDGEREQAVPVLPSSSGSSDLAAAQVTVPLLLLNNSVAGSSLRAKRRLAVPKTAALDNRQLAAGGRLGRGQTSAPSAAEGAKAATTESNSNSMYNSSSSDE